jgi:hypothetical protein
MPAAPLHAISAGGESRLKATAPRMLVDGLRGSFITPPGSASFADGHGANAIRRPGAGACNARTVLFTARGGSLRGCYTLDTKFRHLAALRPAAFALIYWRYIVRERCLCAERIPSSCPMGATGNAPRTQGKR